MEKRSKLTLYMGMFYMLVILLLGLIIITEKKKDFLIPKIKKNIYSYLEEKYQNEIKDFKYDKIIIKDNSYLLKVKNISNKHLYFTVTYKNKKITDTYKKDYLEGNSLNTYMTNTMNNKIKENTANKKVPYKIYTISYNTKLNNCTSSIKEKILNKKYDLPIYTINIEDSYQHINELKVILTNIISYTTSLNLNPKNYNITLNNSQNITKSMNLIIDNDIILTSIDEVVQAVTSNNQKLLQRYNIKLNYLN